MPARKGCAPWNKGKPATDETKRRQSEAHKGIPLSEEHRKNIGKAHKGKPRTEETKMKLSFHFKGRPRSAETIRKMSESAKGKTAWNKGVPCPDETKRKLAIFNTGKRHTGETIAKMRGRSLSAETRERMSTAHKGKQHTEEAIRKMLSRNTPTRLEQQFQAIVDKHGLPYKFVGDGSFMVGRKNPDFININGEKIAVEVYAKYYKLRHAETIDQWKESRREVFGEYGWKIAFFDETQVNEKTVLDRLDGITN